MIAKRIIPCLDIDSGRVVKGTNFKNLRDMGDPAELARFYSDQGADEIVLLDISATHEGRESAYAVIERAARTARVPITAGGGVRSSDDVSRYLRSGADKVSLNSAAVRDPGLINLSAQRFGNQCVVLAVDAKRTGSGWNVYVRGGRDDTGRDAIAWIKDAVTRGAGEILLTSIDRDGVQGGYDLELLRAVTEAVNVPVIASGGAGSLEHIVEAFQVAGADAALVASIVHERRYTIQEIKAYAREKGVLIR
jgi:imidazole glycerol-phosphate synthase subunit HisF